MSMIKGIRFWIKSKDTRHCARLDKLEGWQVDGAPPTWMLLLMLIGRKGGIWDAFGRPN